ncbi:Na+/H+ antiporter subunit A [Luteipulveratus sp. YIM 133132]|uniref:Na+/H+ antiporter subunit A n=1 Tax=Luteipulveratus flavus TaxID=3031728 RepID=UPI0023AF9604|nr:Na+/H+ antiporter subunit A [Luteipulveratus sp. YIM 133132]MDE9364267.1 Na+/H+ antiporter subunit A [Luteipulveratus sp. YIM 133132]
MIALLVIHALAATAAPFLVRLLGRRAFWLLALPPAGAAGWALTQTGAVQDGHGPTESLRWVPSLGMNLTFTLDTLAWLMTLIVGGIGALILVYCSSYFERDAPGMGRFAGCLTGFAGAMLGLVTTDDLLVLYLFWEATTVLSYLLIGHKTTSRDSRSAATQALVVTTAGGLAMLIGIVIIGQSAGTYRISEVLAAPPTGTAVTAAVVLLLAGAISKSALVPFHFWLPGAMAAPTPVSAYLHAAAMVKAGIYLIARFGPAYSGLTEWKVTLLTLGGLTMLIGAWRALRQVDLKLLLAYGTVSQLGFISLVVGAGGHGAALAGLGLLLSHALFKSTLFLSVGAIDCRTGTRDLRRLNGLGRRMPWTAGAALLAGLSMAGLPLLMGFFAKEAAFGAFLLGPEYDAGPTGSAAADTLMLAVMVVGSILTFAYTARFLWGAFATAPHRELTEVFDAGPWLTAVPVLLGAGGLVAGLTATWIEPLLAPYADQWVADNHAVHLGGWHGFNLALLLSVLTWACGAALFAARAPFESAQGRLPRTYSAEQVYRLAMRSLDRASVEVTGAVQRGSLPLSLALILIVFIVVPGSQLLWGGVTWPDQVRWWDSPAQPAVGLVVVAAAVAATRARRRLRAVFLLGVTGYGASMLFLLHGAPDLALTQILVETVSLVVFVLVLRRLSGKFPDDPPRAVRRWRALLGLGVGTVTAAMALTASAVRSTPPSASDLASSAVEFGGGSNIVNVILVDVRAWDTMGELSVVLVAATGVASLVFIGGDVHARGRQLIRASWERRGSYTDVGGAEGSGSRWLAEGGRLAPERRSTIFEVVTRLVFHTIVLWSLYLLFSGHNHPGGGFAAGLMCGLALAVRYLAGSRDELLAAAPVMPGLLMGAGLFLSAGVGLGAMLAGGGPLQSWIFDLHLPLLGHVHLVTSVFFDLGVYLVVIGLMLDILRSLGSRVDTQIEQQDAESVQVAGTHTESGEPAANSSPVREGPMGT